jgi:hypothetical protein
LPASCWRLGVEGPEDGKLTASRQQRRQQVRFCYVQIDGPYRRDENGPNEPPSSPAGVAAEKGAFSPFAFDLTEFVPLHRVRDPRFGVG